MIGGELINEWMFFIGLMVLMIGPACIIAYDELLPKRWVKAINKRIMK